MFTRSRNTSGNQNYHSNRNQTMNPSNTFPGGNNSFNLQGKYQPNIAFKSSGISINEPFKPSSPIALLQPTQNTQQLQQQQPLQTPLSQQQQQQQQQHPTHPINPHQGQTQTQNQPPRLKPILKQSTSLPAQNNPPEDAPLTQLVLPESSAPSAQSDDSGFPTDKETPTDSKDVTRWKPTKVPGSKVNRKLKRLRMNQRLRKTLMPKNAIMVLNEMKAGVQFTFPENQSMLNSLFLVHAELEGKTYIGQGLSKPLARQNAAENALKSLLLEKMTAAALKSKVDEEVDSNQTPKESDSDATPMEVGSSEQSDEIPWSSLASFALYKLFLEWQNQGTVVPIPRPGIQPVKSKPEPKVPVEKKLPPNATSIHPVMLLNQMRPGTTYVEVNRIGNPPHTLFTLSVEIDGEVFSGEAKNKKDAKKLAAKNALHALFGLEYPVDSGNESHNTSLQNESNE